MVDKQIDFLLEELNEENDRLIFTARSITKDFVCEDGLERLANDSINKPLVWRHEHPVNPKFKKTHIYGRVLEAHVEDGKMITKYELYNHTLEHKAVATDLKARDFVKKPLSISLRFRYYENSEGVPIHFDVIEHSLTPTPACKECIVLDIQNEEEKNMSAELEKLIKELEEKLTKKDSLLEELEQKVSKLEKETEAKESTLEQEKAKSVTLEEKLLEFKDRLNEQSKTIEELKEARRMDKLMPLVDKLLELDGAEMEDIYLMKAKDADAEKFFKDRIAKKEKELESTPMPHTKGLDQQASESQQKDEELEDDRKARDESAFQNMPEEFKKKHFGSD